MKLENREKNLISKLHIILANTSSFQKTTATKQKTFKEKSKYVSQGEKSNQ